MFKTSKKRLPALVLAALSGTASAAGFQLLEQSASGLGNAYAGSAATAADASTVYYNPAGMTELSGRNLSLGVNYIDLSSQYSDKGSTGRFAGTGENNGGDAAPVPNGYFTTQLSDSLFLGLGLGAPFGQKTDYSDSWRGRATAITTDIKTININPSLAWKINERWSLGGGVSYQKFDAAYSQGVTSVPSFGLSSATIVIGGDSYAWGWNLGMLFKPDASTKIGLSYRSSVKHKLDGTYRCDGGPASACTAVFGANVRGNAKLDIELPDTWIFSLARQVSERWEVLGDLSHTGWSSIPGINIRLSNGATLSKQYNWRDTTRVALGANYKVDDRWKAKFGIAYDQGVVDDTHRTPRLPDANRWWFSVGGQYKASANGTLDFGYTYIKADKARVADTSTTAIGGGVLNGEFASHVQILGLQYSAKF